MIVTCERCATQFQLDDERVPEDGVRVRCSRCKHAFFIERPARDEAEKVHRIARAALATAPEPTQDLDPGSQAGLPPEDELDEEDWHFADDAPFAGEDPAGVSAADALDDDPLGAADDDGDSGSFDAAGFVGDDDDALDDDDAAPLALDDDDDDPFELSGAGESLSLADDAQAPAAADYQDPGRVPDLETGGDADSGLELDGTEADDEAGGLLADLRDELEEELSPAAPPAPAPPRREAVTRPTQQVVVRPPQQDLGELEAPEEWRVADESESPTIATGLTLPTRTAARVPADLVEDEPSRPALWLARAGNIAGWLCVVGLFAVGLHGGVALQAASPTLAPEPVRVGGFGVSDVNTHWIDNLHAGPLLVISGTLYNESAPPSTGLEVSLLGRDGQPVSQVKAAVGPAVGETTLRTAKPAAFAAAQRELVVDGWPWRPGQERRFHAVAQAVPDQAVWVHFAAVKDAMPVPASLPPVAPAAPLAAQPLKAAAPVESAAAAEPEPAQPTESLAAAEPAAPVAPVTRAASGPPPELIPAAAAADPVTAAAPATAVAPVAQAPAASAPTAPAAPASATPALEPLAPLQPSAPAQPEPLPAAPAP